MRDSQRDDSLVLAYTVASFMRAKKLPNLNSLLEERRKIRERKQKPQTPEEMFAKVISMHKKMTGEGE